MLAYVSKRCGLAALVILTVLASLFLLLHVIPGDPATIALGPRATPEAIERYAERMHLDKPIWTQLFLYVGNALTGDLGADVLSGRPVVAIIDDNLGFTLALVIAGLTWAVAIGVPLGCLAAAKPGSLFDHITGFLSVSLIAVPSFLVSIWALLIFSVTLGWLPAIGAGESGSIADQIRHLILPAFAVGLSWVGYLARFVRASMLDVLSQPYIRSARAFGVPRHRILFDHALRVAILPTITVIGIGFGATISSAVFAEIIFARPGIGKMIFDAVMARNYPVVQGGVLTAAALYVLIVLLSDIIVAWLDPRIRQAL